MTNSYTTHRLVTLIVRKFVSRISKSPSLEFDIETKTQHGWWVQKVVDIAP